LSSILRALKKLEKDSRHIEGNRSLDTKFVPLADTRPRRSAGRFFMIAGIGIICGLVVLAGWYFFSDRHTALPPETATHSSPAVTAKNAPTRPNKRPDMAIAEIPADKAPAVAKSLPVEPAGPAKSAPPADILKGVLPPDQLPIDENGMSIDTSSKPAKNEAPAEHVSKREILRLNEPGMKLQAITWSRMPQKRIAVINNRIVREGESVAGYLVSTINQDDVLLSREGKKWRLQFRIK